MFSCFVYIALGFEKNDIKILKLIINIIYVLTVDVLGFSYLNS